MATDPTSETAESESQQQDTAGALPVVDQSQSTSNRAAKETKAKPARKVPPPLKVRGLHPPQRLHTVNTNGVKGSGIWGRSSRFPDHKQNGPGPDKYNVPSMLKTKLGYSMRGRPNDSLKLDLMLPGPGKYSPTTLRSKQSISFASRYKSKTEISPGPADYVSEEETIGKVGAKYTMRARTKSAWHNDYDYEWRISLGLGGSVQRPLTTTAAEARRKKQGKDGTAGMTSSRSMPALNLSGHASTPGPADYSNLATFGEGAVAKSMSSRHVSKSEYTPGPGRYEADRLFKVGTAGPKYTLHDRTYNPSANSFINGDTEHHRPKPVTPGPGAYGIPTTFKTMSFNAGTPVGPGSSAFNFDVPSSPTNVIPYRRKDKTITV